MDIICCAFYRAYHISTSYILHFAGCVAMPIITLQNIDASMKNMVWFFLEIICYFSNAYIISNWMYILIGWANFNDQDKNWKLMISILKLCILESIELNLIWSECDIFMDTMWKHQRKENFLVVVKKEKQTQKEGTKE